MVGVEVRALRAGEAGDPVHRDAARPAHARAVHHDRVQRHHRVDAGGTGDVRAGPHHHHRADGHRQVRWFGGSDHVGQSLGHQAGLAEAAVVGAHDQVVGPLRQAVGPELQVCGAEADDRRRPPPCLLERPQLGEHRRHTEAAADQHDVAGSSGGDRLDLRRHAEGPDEVGELVALLVVVAHLRGRPAQRLHHHGHGAHALVVVGDGQRDALRPVVQVHHDELPCLRGSGDIRRFHLPQEGVRGQRLAASDAIHP